jgi:hypothetical protein
MLIALAVILLLGLAILALPFGAGLKSESGKRKWFAIIMGIRIPVPDRLIAVIGTRIRKAPGKPAATTSRRACERILRQQEQPLKPPELLRIFRRVWGSMRWFLKGFRLRVRRFDLTVASPDPAWTGMAYGLACAVQSVLPRRWPVRIGVDFNRESPVMAYHLELTAIPMYLFIGAIRFLVKR